MLGDNQHYGHSYILQRYCGFSVPLPIPGRIQHGWTLGAGLGQTHFVEPWPKYVWGQRNLKACREAGYRNVVPLGAPYLYLKPAEAFVPHAKSLLVYPFHGWEKEKVQGDMEAYAQDLETLVGEGFGPVTVCLYWMEFEDPTIREIFQRRGFAIMTNGHRDQNPEFLIRQRQSLLSHAYVTSNRMCTALLYALASGRKAFLYGPPMGLSQTRDPTGAEFDTWQRQTFPELVWDHFRDEPLAELADRELGREFVRSPAQLRALFGWSPRGTPRLVRNSIVRQLWRVPQARRLWSRDPSRPK